MLTKRKTSTIPFGYKEASEKGFLEPIPEQIKELINHTQERYRFLLY